MHSYEHWHSMMMKKTNIEGRGKRKKKEVGLVQEMSFGIVSQHDVGFSTAYVCVCVCVCVCLCVIRLSHSHLGAVGYLPQAVGTTHCNTSSGKHSLFLIICIVCFFF